MTVNYDYRGYTFGIRDMTTQKEERIMETHQDLCFVYNRALDMISWQRLIAYRSGLNMPGLGFEFKVSTSLSTMYSHVKYLRKYNEFLSTHAFTLAMELKSLKYAIESYYKVPDRGWPEFKKWVRREVSIPFQLTYGTTSGNARLDAKMVDGRRMWVLTIGGVGTFRLTRGGNVVGQPTGGRLIRRKDGVYEVNLRFRTEQKPPKLHTPKIIGMDRNVGNIATSDNKLYVRPKVVVKRIKNLLKRIKKLQRILSLKTEGSKNYVRTLIMLRKRFMDLTNLKKTILHRLTSELRKQKITHVVMEDLQIANMTASAKGTAEEPGKNVAQKSGLNRSILGESWYYLEMLCGYKLEGGVIKVNPHHTSQMCAVCGYVHKDNRHEREFSCLQCGHTDHADINASVNIVRRGEAVMTPRGPDIVGNKPQGSTKPNEPQVITIWPEEHKID